MRLTNKSPVELHEIIRKDPTRRRAAWAELTFRNRYRQEFERANGGPVKMVLKWEPPTLAYFGTTEPPQKA